jgi:hypothetical protein
MASQRPWSGRSRRSRRRAKGARPPPDAADALGGFSDALSLLSVAQSSLSAKENPGTGDEVVAIPYAADALKCIYIELEGAPRSPATG